MYSDLKQGCGLLQAEKEIHNREKLKSAFKELEEQRIITKYEVDEKKEGNKIVDVKYIVIPSADFVHEQKAANKRKNIIEDK